MSNRTVAVVLRADTGQFQAGLLKASSQVRMLGTDTDAATSRADKGFRQASQGASMFGGALKTAAAAGAGLAAANFLKGAIGAASDLNETLNKSNVIFGQNAGKIERWANDAATNFGLSKSAALEAASGFGNMLQQLGFAGDAAVEASTGVVKLAADLGSFNNLETEDVLDRIGAAMRGEYDSLQLLVPNINAARVEQEAMAETGKENAKELTAQEKAAAVLAIVHKDGAAAADDFAETSDGLANSTKIAKAKFEDLRAEIGQRFLPVAQDAMGFISSNAIPALGDAADAVFDLAGAFGNLPGPFKVGIIALGAWAAAGDEVSSAFNSVQANFRSFLDEIPVQRALYQQQAHDISDVERALGGLGTGASSAAQNLSSVQLMMRGWDTNLANVAVESDNASVATRTFGDRLSGMAGVAGGVALSGLQKLGRAIGPELAVAAGAATLFGFIDGLKSMTQASDEAKAAAQGLADALTLTDEAADRRAIRSAIEDVDGLVEVLDQAGVSSNEAINGLLGQEGAQRRVLAALRDYRSEAYTPTGAGGSRESQDAREAVLAYEELATGYGTAASNARYFGQEADAAATSTDESGAAATKAATPVDMYGAYLEFAAAAASDAKKQTDSFKMSLDILTGAHVSMAQAEAAVQSAMAEATGAIKENEGAVLTNAGALNLQSANGRAALDTLVGYTDAANMQIATMIQQGASIEDVRVGEALLREGFIKTATDMGISRVAAENLTNQYYGIPEDRNTKITADVEQARAGIAAVHTDINNLPNKTVTVTLKADGTVAAILGDPNQRTRAGVPVGFADGGYTGPGGKYQYAGPAHKGEVIWSQEDVAAHGGPQRVDAMRRARGYADGGIAVNFDSNPLVSTLRTVRDRLQEPATRAVGALAFARSQAGKPYVWGAAGPSGYDCSGFMSAITNYLRGKSPYSRVGSTANFPWGGFAPGYGMFTVGSTPNAGGGIGHMAGTLMGVNVESTGNHVRVGGDAHGASDRMFSTRAHLAMAGGGLIGEPVVGSGLWSGRSYSFGERGDEIVLPRSREFSGASGGSTRGGVTVNLEGLRIAGTVSFDPSGMMHFVDGRVDEAFTTVIERGQYNP